MKKKNVKEVQLETLDLGIVTGFMNLIFVF